MDWFCIFLVPGQTRRGENLRPDALTKELPRHLEYVCWITTSHSPISDPKAIQDFVSVTTLSIAVESQKLQLVYRENGAICRTRTDDLQITNQLLYQLS